VILLFGSSGHASVIIDIVEKESTYTIFGLIDPHKEINEELMGYKIAGKEEDLEEIVVRHNIVGGIIGIGDNWLRQRVRDKVLENYPHFNFLTCIHPSAQIARDVTIGCGTVIMPGAIVNASCIVKEHCVLNTNCSLDHASMMDDFSSLAPNATVGGNVTIGKCSAISLGANVMQSVEIGEHSIVGAGSLVNQNIENFSVCYGVPARFIRGRKIGEKYL
jgi:sugar O-acyltransferase (sialic acid O-acetyltransferase NeuD family)